MLRLIALIMIVVSLSCKSSESPSEPPTGGTQEELIYVFVDMNLDGNYDIYTLNPNTFEFKPLIATSFGERFPFVFNDKIYFSANDDGDYDIYVANLDGSNRIKITDLPNDEVEPFLSSDGRYLAFTWGVTGNLKVVLYDLQNNDTVRTFGFSNMTNLSPAFVGNDTLIMTLQDYDGVYSQDLWMYIISRDTLINLKNTPTYQEAHWNVKDGKIVFARMGLYGDNPHIVLANFPSLANEQVIYSNIIRPTRPIFSPDGSKVALTLAGRCIVMTVDISTLKVDTLIEAQGECYTYYWK